MSRPVRLLRTPGRTAAHRAAHLLLLLSLALGTACGSREAVKPDGSSPASQKITRLDMQDLVVGTGDTAEEGKLVSVHYTGWLLDGTKFDSSLDRGQPIQFQLGSGRVIEGWDQGLLGMKVGGKRKLTIPAKMAYGSKGMGKVIPPNSPLVFEVELVEVN